MAEADLSPIEKERLFNAWLVSEYFRYGSVDEVFKIHRYAIPISYPSYQRLLDKWGVMKAAGPNSKLNEVLEFLTRLAEESIPLESLYRKMPPSFRTSVSTMHRILGYIKEGITRRVGTALVIVPKGDERQMLLGNDISTPRVELGKGFNSLSIPMGFSRKRDLREEAILRVLQQEVYMQDAVNRTLSKKLIPEFPRPFMLLDVVDVRVEVFLLKLGTKVLREKQFSSYKLKNHKFYAIDNILSEDAIKSNLRAGVFEIARGYNRFLELSSKNFAMNPIHERSQLNRELAILTVD
jgi:hypothetical protein